MSFVSLDTLLEAADVMERPSAKAAARKYKVAVQGKPSQKKKIKRPSHRILYLVQSELVEVLEQMDKSQMTYQEAASVLNTTLLQKGISRETYQFSKESLYKIRNGRILGNLTGREPVKMDRIGKLCAPQRASEIKPRDLSKQEIEDILQQWKEYGTGSLIFLRDHPQYQFLTRQALEHWKRDDPRFSHWVWK